MNGTIYLDNNATTRVDPAVVMAMMPFFSERYGNPSSMHAFGGRVHQEIENARAKVAELIHADPSEIIFTGSGSESDNQAIFGGVEAMGRDTTVITTRVEHPAVLQSCRHLRKQGFNVVEVGVMSDGTLNIDEYSAALATPGKKFVSMMWANNETGVVFPIKKAADKAAAAGAVFHTDAVQAVGKIAEVDVSKIPVNMLSFSGHKIHAPKGIGVLYVRKGTRISPLIHGGHQEGGRRAGTENVPYIIGLGKAAEMAMDELASGEAKRISAMRDKLQAGLVKCPDAMINGSLNERLPNTLNISFQYIEGEGMLYHMSDAGICASSGSACTSGSLEPSHVVRAMGVPFTAVHGSIRFSFSRYNTEQEVDYVLSVVPKVVDKLRGLSPFVK